MKTKEKAWKKYLVDTGAMLLAAFPAGLFAEVILAGMTLGQSLHARFMAVWVDILTARPYGIYRDYIFSKFRTIESSSLLKKCLTDTFSYVTFQVPVYILILFIAGATFNQALIATVSATLFSSVSGRPYGMFLDWFRRLFGLATATNHLPIKK